MWCWMSGVRSLNSTSCCIVLNFCCCCCCDCCQVAYRGIPTKVSISCLQEEVGIRIQCMLRSHAASCGDLEPLFCEESLADPKFKGKDGFVDKALLLASSAARAAANKLLAGDAATDGDTVKAPLINLMSSLLRFDC